MALATVKCNDVVTTVTIIDNDNSDNDIDNNNNRNEIMSIVKLMTIYINNIVVLTVTVTDRHQTKVCRRDSQMNDKVA